MPTDRATGEDSWVWASMSQQQLSGRKGFPAPEGAVELKFQKWQEAMAGAPMDVELSLRCLL
ncbi:hypothetical protein I79_024028 [Cricetulus griseus]|uniref:Uncharacterized protein n=1 Tax=Cricetulus griseus TaxID=10029 RepID=G3IJJ3_CRIGR|nr:hypothetical protein I79_024028 [Cricetulus griseus]